MKRYPPVGSRGQLRLWVYPPASARIICGIHEFLYGENGATPQVTFEIPACGHLHLGVGWEWIPDSGQYICGPMPLRGQDYTTFKPGDSVTISASRCEITDWDDLDSLHALIWR